PASPTFKKTYKTELSSENNNQLFVPAGFAHGFITLSETSVFGYKCDKYYNKESESGIIWNDSQLAINWEFPKDNIILSEKDANLPKLENLKL
ncbi:MAG TPA: dTDP-4-dehydrorhamnose 3,5-epimerase, partial [Salinimicrobium sp.]|nr:dTDP-4-dehydrorhamnose 3,5-epimerase [Salinimicrobium sp.]